MEKEKEVMQLTITDLMQEVSHSLKNTYLGIVKQVAKAADYAETNKRIFVLEWNDLMVFMHEDDAPAEISRYKRASSIIGKPIPFKPKKYDSNTKQLFVSFAEIVDMYQRLCNKKTMLKGNVVSVEEELLKIECLGDILYMPKDEFYYIKTALTPSLEGKKIYFLVKEVKEDNTVLVTRLPLLEKERDEIIKELQDGAVIEASVASVESWGLSLLYKGHKLILRNKDFSLDFTKANRVYKRGDKISVKLVEISYTKRILVQPVEKYDANKNVDVTKYEVGDTLLGDVVTITPTGIYVNLEPGLDALCPIPNPLYYREPYIGESVMIKISKILPEKNTLRGKIVSFVKDAKDAQPQ